MNYKSTTITGESWQRCRRVIIENTYNNIPVIYFQEEKKFPMGNDEYGTVELGSVIASLTDPTIEFPELGLDGLPTGEVKTYMDVYLLMNSLYMYLAGVRDLPPVTPPVG